LRFFPLFSSLLLFNFSLYLLLRIRPGFCRTIDQSSWLLQINQLAAGTRETWTESMGNRLIAPVAGARGAFSVRDAVENPIIEGRR
jgi:hypothetical protein